MRRLKEPLTHQNIWNGNYCSIRIAYYKSPSIYSLPDPFNAGKHLVKKLYKEKHWRIQIKITMKDVLEDISLFVGHWYTCFGLLMKSAMGFRATHLCALSPTCNRFLMLTSSVTLADLLVDSMAAQSFYPWTCIQALLALESRIKCAAAHSMWQDRWCSTAWATPARLLQWKTFDVLDLWL